MTQQRHDRILPLDCLNAYPGRDTLDVTLFLPQAEDTRRRVWLLCPEGCPSASFDDVTLEPSRVVEGEFRWIDFGVAELPIGPPNRAFLQLRVRGLKPHVCAESHLVVTRKLDLLLDGLNLEEAERRLWGLSRGDVGVTALRPSRVTAGSPTTFIVRYSVGPRGLPTGALVRFNLPASFAHPQTHDPEAPGYAVLTRADAGVTIARIEQPSAESHEKADVVCRLEEGLRPGQGFELTYSTDHTHIFTNTCATVDRRYWYSKLPPLSAAATLSEEHPFVSLAEGGGHTCEFAAGPPERLHLFLPGRRFASEQLTLRGTFTDRYRNSPPTGPIDSSVDLYLIAGDERIPLGSPEGRFVARHRFEVELPELPAGVYRAVACSQGTGEQVALSNPLEIVPPAPGADRLYWGEIHGHTEMSDGSGTYEGLYRHARQEGCLDFAAAADHACYFSDNEWLWMQDVTNAWNDPGRFVTLVGYEWAGRQVHRNVYTSRDRLALFRGMYPPTSNIDAVWEHFHGDEQVVGGPHAPLAHGLLWEHHDPSVERFIEVYSMWGASDFRANPLVPRFARENERGMTFNEVLRSGAKLGFTAGGDCHEGRVGFSQEDPEGQGNRPHTFAAVLFFRCGMTAALLPSLDRRALIGALRLRRTYATTGARILLDFSVSGSPMGSEVSAREVVCRAKVHGVGPLRRIDVLRDGTIVHSADTDALDAEVAWRDPEPGAGEHYYYLHVVQADGEQAWSTPVWVTCGQEEAR